MPPRHVYWTIILEGKPTAFRAHTREELEPTLRQLQSRHPDAVLMWFARGRLWDSPELERASRSGKRDGERRGPEWRPGGLHRDPRDRFKVPRDEKRRRFADRLRRDRLDPDRDREGSTPRREDQRERPQKPFDPSRDRRPRGPAGDRTSFRPSGDRRPTGPSNDRRPGGRPSSDRRPGGRPSSDRRPSGPPGDRRPRGPSSVQRPRGPRADRGKGFRQGGGPGGSARSGGFRKPGGGKKGGGGRGGPSR